MRFRIALALISALLLLPAESSARVYKCEAETGIAYSSQPCPEEATVTVIETASVPAQEKCDSGQVETGQQRMLVKDALALSETRDDSQTIHVYLYPFKLSEQDRKKISASRSHALSPHQDLSRNPDPSDGEVTPVVEFQFVLKNPARPIASGNIRHWRFVSWMKETPTTLNNPGSTLGENFELVQETRINEQPALRLKTRSGQTFADTRYGWNLDVTVPLITSEG
jgi:hypothetical protein